MIQMMQMRDRALGSLVNDVNQVLSQSPSRAQVAVVDVSCLDTSTSHIPPSQESDIWGGMSSPLLAPYWMPQLLHFLVPTQPVEDNNDLANQNNPFLRSLPPTIWQGCTYVIYHGASASDAGVYQTWAKVSVLTGPGPPWSDRSIFKKFLSIVQAQESFSEATCCGLITALMASLPNDGYECWVVTRGFKPGLYTKQTCETNLQSCKTKNQIQQGCVAKAFMRVYEILFQIFLEPSKGSKISHFGHIFWREKL
ncbi:hypothetical protein C8J56DRAFT_890819 [Mycena floridula]|nr:hypothetical protein C8J56DRAFT_890819 [Mycena floridula]